MIRLFLFVSFLLVYSAIGLVAGSQYGPTEVATSNTNVTVMYKTSATPVLGSLVVERCAVADCSNAISI